MRKSPTTPFEAYPTFHYWFFHPFIDMSPDFHLLMSLFEFHFFWIASSDCCGLEPSCKRDLVLHTNLSRLRGYLTRGAASTDSRRPFDEDCHLAFLEWVSRLKCPNYNCRQKGFKSLESFSNHVSNCVYLLETDYWCSFCCQVEYLGVEECRGRSFIVNDSNRDSKLRRAGQFLKRISCVYYRNPIKKFHRRNLGMVANSTELATNAGYPWWKAELETHEHAVLIPDRSSIEWTPQYPNDPKDFRYSITENPKELYELETSCNGEPSGQNPAAIRSSQTLRSLNGNRRRSEIPTIQEMEASNSRRMSASYLSTPRGRTTSSSHENTKSQRNSRFGLRVSTTSRPLENTPAAYTFEQFPASDPKTSNFSISSSVIPGSSPVEPSGLVSPQCDPHIPIIVGQHPQDHDVISPISTEGVQPCDQIPQNLVSPTTYLASGPNSVQEDRVVQRGHMTPHFSGSDEGPRRLRCEQILGTMIEPTTENSPILTEDIKNRAPPEYAEVPIVYRNQARDEPELEDFAPSLLLEQVINPLLQHSDFEPFHPLILEARHLLSSGHLRNVRDVDVMLVACCRVSATSVYHLRSNPLMEHRNIVNHKI